MGGTVPTLLYYGLKICSPSIIVPLTFILCAITSLFTGSSFSSIATMGLALFGVGGIVTKSVTDAPALQDAGIARIHIADMDQRPVAGTYPAQYYFISRGGSMLSMEDFARKAPELLRIGRENGVVVIGSIAASAPENWVSYARQMVRDFDALLAEKGTDAQGLVGRTADRIVTYQNLGSLPRRQVELRTELCAGCGEKTCVTTCYFGGMTLENGRLVHRQDDCSGCGLCAHSCGRGAVTIRELE